jgi:hypothetical protein
MPDATGQNPRRFWPVKTVWIESLIDLHGFCRSLVIPLPGDRALRVGFRIESWCKLGPRRYKVAATEQFAEQMERIAGIEDGRAWLEDMGVEVKGERNGSH